MTSRAPSMTTGPGEPEGEAVELDEFGFDDDRWLSVLRAGRQSALGRLGGYDLLAEVGRGGQGLRVPRPPTGDRTGGRAQAPPRGIVRDGRRAEALRARGRGRVRAPPCRDRHDLRRRAGRRRAGARDGVDRRRADHTVGRERGRTLARGDPGGVRPHVRRRRARASGRGHPPRPQAVEHPRGPRGPPASPRLRDGEALAAGRRTERRSPAPGSSAPSRTRRRSR